MEMDHYILVDTPFSTTDLILSENIDYISYNKKDDEVVLSPYQLKEICKEMYERGRLEN